MDVGDPKDSSSSLSDHVVVLQAFLDWTPNGEQQLCLDLFVGYVHDRSAPPGAEVPVGDDALSAILLETLAHQGLMIQADWKDPYEAANQAAQLADYAGIDDSFDLDWSSTSGPAAVDDVLAVFDQWLERFGLSCVALDGGDCGSAVITRNPDALIAKATTIGLRLYRPELRLAGGIGVFPTE